MSNLIATDQVRGGDWVRVEYDEDGKVLRFAREAEGLPVQDMARLVDTSITIPQLTMSTGAVIEPVRTQTAKTSKRG